MPTQLDLTDVDSFSGGGGPYEEGMYAARVKEVTHEISDNSGEEYLNWEFEILEGPDTGRPVWANTSLQRQAWGAVKAVVEALFPGDEEALTMNSSELAEKALGRECRLYIVPDEYETSDGETRHTADVQSFLPPGGSEEAEEQEMAASSASGSASSEEDDDIPF